MKSTLGFEIHRDIYSKKSIPNNYDVEVGKNSPIYKLYFPVIELFALGQCNTIHPWFIFFASMSLQSKRTPFVH
jgi:hypothetical protein